MMQQTAGALPLIAFWRNTAPNCKVTCLRVYRNSLAPKKTGGAISGASRNPPTWIDV